MEIQAAIKAAPYCYRSYNPASIKLYAERYAWWVESLDVDEGVERLMMTIPRNEPREHRTSNDLGSEVLPGIYSIDSIILSLL